MADRATTTSSVKTVHITGCIEGGLQCSDLRNRLRKELSTGAEIDDMKFSTAAGITILEDTDICRTTINKYTAQGHQGACRAANRPESGKGEVSVLEADSAKSSSQRLHGNCTLPTEDTVIFFHFGVAEIIPRSSSRPYQQARSTNLDFDGKGRIRPLEEWSDARPAASPTSPSKSSDVSFLPFLRHTDGWTLQEEIDLEQEVQSLGWCACTATLNHEDSEVDAIKWVDCWVEFVVSPIPCDGRDAENAEEGSICEATPKQGPAREGSLEMLSEELKGFQL